MENQLRKNIISMKDIVMDFGNGEVLKGITLGIKNQNIFGLLGPSGAGKTTILKIITGQLNPTSGKTFVKGMSSKNLDEKSYRNMGLVLDTHGLYERLTCWQNLSLYAEIYDVDKKLIDTSLAEIGLLESKNKQVLNLSKGMKQRLAIARATLHSPGILFLDEPTSGLDPIAMNLMHDKILDIRDKGTTIFLTTHNMEEAYKLCDTVALLNEGVIVEIDEPARLCRKYDSRNEIELILKNGEKKIVLNNPQSANLIKDYFSKNQIESIHSSEPNLETVFIHLTGRGLL